MFIQFITKQNLIIHGKEKMSKAFPDKPLLRIKQLSQGTESEAIFMFHLSNNTKNTYSHTENLQVSEI